VSRVDGNGRIVRLKAIAFEHPRNVLPLKASAEAYQLQHPGVEVAWEARSLRDFEDYPVDRLAERYDLVIMDHPFVGTAVEKGALVPLDEYLPTAYLADQEKNSVGPSYRSYAWEGHQWALAVDAAAQVSAYREDLLGGAGLKVPTTWDEVFGLLGALPDGTKIGLSLNPTHSYCSFVSLCAGLGGEGFWDDAEGLEPAVAEEALGLLRRLAGEAHEASLELNPIKFTELMASGDEIAYAPLLFGYSSYARPGFAPRLVRFADLPSFREEPEGAVLGGVGLAVSAHSKHREEAVDYLSYVAGEECQKGLYFESGGQPGHRAAWEDPEVNERSSGFFRGTLRTMDLAYLRPRYSGFPNFQKKAGGRIHRFLRDGGGCREAVEDLNRLHGEARAVPLG
jgi:multiple sugar transport system substrate-binding protein